MIKLFTIILSAVIIIVAELYWDAKNEQNVSLIFAIRIILLEFLGVALIFIAIVFF